MSKQGLTGRRVAQLEEQLGEVRPSYGVWLMIEDGDNPDHALLMNEEELRELLLAWRALKGCLVCGQESEGWEWGGDSVGAGDVIDVEAIEEDQDD